MACTKNLKDLISLPVTSSGVWTFEGMSNIPLSIGNQGANSLYGEYSPFSSTPTLVGDIIFNTGNLTNATFNPSDGWDGLANDDTIIPHLGYFHMDFHLGGLGGCITRATIQVIRNICSGGAVTKTLCDDELLTDIDIRATLWAETPCAGQTPPSQETPHDNVITHLGETSVITDDNASGAMFIVNMGDNQHEWIDVSMLTVDGIFNYTNTVNINPAYTYDCNDCNETEISTYTLTRIVGTAGELIYNPYLVVCDDPSCSVAMGDTLTTEREDGEWWYLGVQLGDVTNPNIINQDINMEVGSNPPAQSYSWNTLISVTHNDTFNFTTSTLNTTYAFMYRVNGGTPCEDTQVIYIRLEETGNAGTAPVDITECYRDFLPNQLGGNPIYNLWNQLGGMPSAPGLWTMSVLSTDIFPASIVTDAFTSSDLDVTMATYDFSYLDDALYLGKKISLRFTYTSTPTGATLCGACTTSSSTWDVFIGAGCSASVSPSDNTDYYNNTVAYPCSGCTVDAYTDFLKVTVGTCGYWRVKNATPAIVDLIVDGAAPNTFNPNATINNGMTTHYNPELDWSNVPAGSYVIQYVVGTQYTEINCNRVVEVYIDVTDPCTGSCTNTVQINNGGELTSIQLENFSQLSGVGGFSFPYDTTSTVAMDLFIVHYKTWIEAQSCISTSIASYFISGGTTYLYLDADQGGVGEHRNATTASPAATFNFDNPVDCVPCATSVNITELNGVLTASVSDCTLPMYLWSTGATTQTIPLNGSGTYTVDVTCSTNGCLVTNNYIFNCPAMVVEIGALGNELTAYVTTGTCGGTYSYLWNNGETTQTITALATGDYTCTVTCSENQCDATSAIYTLTSTDPCDFCVLYTNRSPVLTIENWTLNDGVIDIALNTEPEFSFPYTNDIAGMLTFTTNFNTWLGNNDPCNTAVAEFFSSDPASFTLSYMINTNYLFTSIDYNGGSNSTSSGMDCPECDTSGIVVTITPSGSDLTVATTGNIVPYYIWYADGVQVHEGGNLTGGATLTGYSVGVTYIVTAIGFGGCYTDSAPYIENTPADFTIDKFIVTTVLDSTSIEVTSLKDDSGTEILTGNYVLSPTSATPVNIPNLESDIETYLGVGNYTSVTANTDRTGLSISVLGAIMLGTIKDITIAEIGNSGNNIIDVFKGNTATKQNSCDYTTTVTTSATRKIQRVYSTFIKAAITDTGVVFANGYDMADSGDRTSLQTDIGNYLTSNSYSYTAVNVVNIGGSTGTITVTGSELPLSYVMFIDNTNATDIPSVEFTHSNCIIN